MKDSNEESEMQEGNMQSDFPNQHKCKLNLKNSMSPTHQMLNDKKPEFDLIFIGNTDVDSDLDIFLDQNGLDSKLQNKPSEEEAILAGLQNIINERYLNSSKIFVHDSDHNHDHMKENEDTFEFEYICEIPFPNQVNQQNTTLIHVPEIPEYHDKLLNERIQNMLTAYRCNLYSYEKDSYSMSRPLKKRRIKY